MKECNCSFLADWYVSIIDTFVSVFLVVGFLEHSLVVCCIILRLSHFKSTFAEKAVLRITNPVPIAPHMQHFVCRVPSVLFFLHCKCFVPSTFPQELLFSFLCGNCVVVAAGLKSKVTNAATVLCILVLDTASGGQEGWSMKAQKYVFIKTEV